MAFAAHLVPLFSDRLRPVAQRAQSDSPARSQTHNAPQADAAHEQRQRGVIGYHNPFQDPSAPDPTQDDTPPAYRTSHPQRLPPRSSLDDDSHNAASPDYNCSVFCDGRVDLKIERKTPFDVVEDPKWESVYAILQGTVLNLHSIRSANPLAMSANSTLPDRRVGKLIRSYTLQHAEAGLAADYKKYELVPKSQLTHLLSASAQRQLQLTEPSKFDRVYQYVIRMRLEAQQVLLRFKTSTERTTWLNNITAAIDIAPPLEARNEPKYITLPRRRRRRATNGENAALDALREQQARIIREHYPQLGEAHAQLGVAHTQSAEAHDDQGEPDTVQDFDDGRPAEAGATEGQERDIDAEEDSHLPPQLAGANADTSAQITGLINQVNRIFDAHAGPSVPRIRVHVRSPNQPSRTSAKERTDFDDEGKWAPHIPIDLAQESRIRRRCMPSLLFNSKRASDIIISQGRRFMIDNESRSLKPWSGSPPSYTEARDGAHDEASSAPALQGASPTFQTHAISAFSSLPNHSARNLLIRIRSAPEHSGVDGTQATSATTDDIISTDGSSHDTPTPKGFLSRTANKLRRMASRQQDVQTHSPKRDSGISSQAGMEQDAHTDLRKIQSQMTGIGSTTSLSAGCTEHGPVGF